MRLCLSARRYSRLPPRKIVPTHPPRGCKITKRRYSAGLDDATAVELSDPSAVPEQEARRAAREREGKKINSDLQKLEKVHGHVCAWASHDDCLVLRTMLRLLFTPSQ